MKKMLGFLTIVFTVIAMIVPTVTAYAWGQPTVTANCAPDSNHYSFTITLASETDYNIQWSWKSDFSVYTSATEQAGDNPLTVTRDGTTLYVRWASDHSSSNSATANGTLCHNVLPPPPPPPPPTQAIGLAMLYCTDGSRCYDQGADGVCWIKYSLAVGQMFDTANAVLWCDLGPGKSYDPKVMKVYVDPDTGRSFMGEVFLGYPYTKQCWGPDNKGNCVLDELLAKFNWANGTRYQYGWLFSGFGGH